MDKVQQSSKVRRSGGVSGNIANDEDSEEDYYDSIAVNLRESSASMNLYEKKKKKHKNNKKTTPAAHIQLLDQDGNSSYD